MPMYTDTNQYERRFVGTKNLYGKDALACFERLHVYVIGIGGVGSWAAEALARTAIGRITLVDMDVLSVSNTNRQLPAITDNFGKNKIDAMAQKMAQINPRCIIDLVDEFIDADNVAKILPKKGAKHCVVLDCTDDMNAKMAIALHCRFNKIRLVCAGGVGAKTDPTCVMVGDLKDTTQDRLLAKMRQNLRQKGINADLREKFNILCVYSNEPMQFAPKVHKASHAQGARLSCAGYGSAVVVTATVAMVMVSVCLDFAKKMCDAE